MTDVKKTKKTTAKKTTAKKTTAKKAPKTTTKKATTKKPTTKKATTKKATAKKAPVEILATVTKPKTVRKVKIEETQALKDKRVKEPIVEDQGAKEIKIEHYMGTTEEWDKWNERQAKVLIEVYNTDGLKKIYASRKRKGRFNSFFKKIKLPFRLSVAKEDKVIHESINKAILKLSQFNDTWLKDAKEIQRNTSEGILANDIPHLSSKRLKLFLDNKPDISLSHLSYDQLLKYLKAQSGQDV